MSVNAQRDGAARIVAHDVERAIDADHGVNGGSAVSVGFRNMFSDNVNAASVSGLQQSR